MSPRSQYYLYRFAAVIALCAAVGFGIAGVLAAVQGRLPALQMHVGATGLFGCLAWFARKRSKALQAEQALTVQLAAGEFFETFRQSPDAISGFGIRWNFRAYLLSAGLIVVLSLIVFLLVQKNESILAVVSGLLGLVVARSLGAMLRQPERLHIGPEGLNDHSRFGLIPWSAIDHVSLVGTVLKGDIKAMLQVKVNNIKPYLERLGPVRRWLWTRDPAPDIIPFPLQGHEVMPSDVYLIVRHFHERALPPDSISDQGDNGYVVKR